MAHWSTSKLIKELDATVPEWRLDFADPYDAAAYYGLEVRYTTRDGYSELDFSEPDYGDLYDGFNDADRD